MRKLLENRIDEHRQVFELLSEDERVKQEIDKAGQLIVEALKNKGAIYLCGNGGSAADAQHIATEFVSRFYKERQALNAEALTTNTSSLTAIANDYDYERVFVRQLEAKAKEGDVLIGISTSGSSGNVVKALEYAYNNGIGTIMLTGNRIDDKIVDRIDCSIRVPSDDTPRIQEGHIFVGHVLAEYAEDNV